MPKTHRIEKENQYTKIQFSNIKKYISETDIVLL